MEGIAVDGRNLPKLAVMTFGESWHNNHHAFPRSARMGHNDRQIDPGWWVIRSLAAMGLAWAVNVPDLTAGRSGMLKPYVT
jgi:fatty-acid desaturase